MAKLTKQERQTLDKAMAILQSHTVEGACWMLNPRRDWLTVTYFDSRGFQHPDLLPYTGGAFSDAIDAGLEHEARVLSPEEIKAKRIAELRQQLSALTDEAA